MKITDNKPKRPKPKRAKAAQKSPAPPSSLMDGLFLATVTSIRTDGQGKIEGGGYQLLPPERGFGGFRTGPGLQGVNYGDTLLLEFSDGVLQKASLWLGKLKPARQKGALKPSPPGEEDPALVFEQPGDEAPLPTNPKTLHGATKPDLTLIPPVAIAHMAMAMEHGAAKYGAYNWRTNQVEARTYVAASLRHLCDWLDGQEVALDSGVHNLAAAMANCAIILDAQEQLNLIDNRPPPGKSALVMERFREQKERAIKEKGQ